MKLYRRPKHCYPDRVEPTYVHGKPWDFWHPFKAELKFNRPRVFISVRP